MALVKLTWPPLGFGAFKIGRNTGTKYGVDYELPDDAAVSVLLNGLLDLGVTYVDTAPAYGLSEVRIGKAIGHRRTEFVLSTKVGEHFENGQSRHDFSSHAVTKSVEESLRRLRTDVLDAVFIHSSRDDLNVVTKAEVVPTLVGLRQKGLVKAIGLSGYTAEGYRASFSWADVLMVEYHREQNSLADVMAEASERNIGVIVKKALASGTLNAEESIRFALANNNVDSVVVGSLSLEHMRRNWNAACSARNWSSGRRGPSTVVAS